MKRLILLGLITAFGVLGNTAFSQEITDLESALEQARVEDKGVALYLYSSSLETPNNLADIFPEGDDWVIQAYLDSYFVPVAIDADSNVGQELAERYNALGWFPTLFFIDQQGNRESFYMIKSEETDPGDMAHFFLMNEIMAGRISTNG